MSVRSGKSARGARRYAGAAAAAVFASAAAFGGAAAQVAPDYLDPALGGAAEIEAASILIVDPAAAARLEPHAVATPAPTTDLRRAIEAEAPAGASWTQIYARRGFEPIWLAETAAGGVAWDKVDALISAAHGADAHALPTARYGLNDLETRIAAVRAGGAVADLAALEVELTRLYLHLGRDLASGALEPSELMRTLDIAPPRPEPVLLLADASSWDARETAERIAALAPQTDDYRSLMALYEDLRAQRAGGGVQDTLVPSDQTLRPRDQGPRIAALRTRLKELGLLPPNAADLIDPATGEVVFGPMTEDAVRALQAQRGLEVDGVVGGATFAALNQTLDDRIALVAVNLERARWTNVDHGAARHIIVNIAAYHTTVYEDRRVIFETDVVVGTTRHQTPEFSDEMSHVVVNPHWHVPYSIATEELLPVLQDNPGALRARNFDVLDQSGYPVDPWSIDWWSLSENYFPYRLRQGPGPGNALGNVKFIFPNHHAVYLHDTPARNLFQRAVRAFSHGCIRVADPEGLAEVLLGAQHSDPLNYYNELRTRPGEVFVELDRYVPITITYRTVWVDESGAVQYRDDLYGRDARIFEALQGIGLAV